MEGRKEDVSGSMPPNTGAFGGASHMTSYLDSLLQGVAASAPTAPPQPPPFNPMEEQQHAQTQFQPTFWSYGDDHASFPTGYTGWSMYAPSMDLGPGPADLGGAGDAVPATTSGFPGYEEYLASLSQPDSNSDNGSESGPMGSSFTGGAFGSGFRGDYQRAAESGHEMYTEALNQWSSYVGKTYNPFGTTEVFQDLDSNAVPVSGKQTPPIGTQSSRPSYSDVAKNLPTSSGSGGSHKSCGSKSKETFGKIPPAEFPPQGSSRVSYKKSKSSKSFSHKSKTNSPDISPAVKPDSKYGLDSFEDPAKILKEKTRRQHSSGSESMPQSRKGSTSSVGSGTSSVDELYYTKLHTSASTGPDAKPLYESVAATAKVSSDKFEEIPNTQYMPKPIFENNTPTPPNNKKSEKKSGKTQEKPFFDPKRIFAKRSSKGGQSNTADSIPNNQQRGHHDTLLNNGKPKSSLFTNCNFGKSTSNYINNDLGQNKKQTNMDSRSSPTREKSCNATAGRHMLSDQGEPSTSERPSSGGSATRRKVENLGSSKKVDPKQQPSRRSRKQKEEPNPIGKHEVFYVCHLHIYVLRFPSKVRN